MRPRVDAYTLVANEGETAHQEITDVKGVTTCTYMDGLGRVFRETRQNADGADGNKRMRDTYAARYDARGQLQQETRYDWLDENNKVLTLTSTFGYDDWGQQVSETGPDGVVAYSLMNPFGWRTGDGHYMPTQSSWQQARNDPDKHYGRVESKLNLLGKPDAVERFDLDRQSMGKQLYRYDGLGRMVEEVSVLGHIGSYRYDTFDRMVESTLPNHDKVLRSYAAHSIAELASGVTVQSAYARLAAVIAGEQSFDGLGRLIQLRTGGRIENYRYNSSHLRISERITPSNASIHYTYDLGLTEEPIRTQSPDGDVSFEYDEKSARMLKSVNREGERSYTYDAAGHLQQNIWKASGQTWATRYTNSLLGRQLQRTDASGIRTVYSHDNFGRVSSVIQGQLQAAFRYDSLSRTTGTRTTDMMSGAYLDTVVEYDEHSRETLRTLSMSGRPARTVRQVWRADDQLLSRHLQEAGKSLLLEEFTYDNRGRLMLFSCSGATLPRNRQGRKIISQLFRFDTLDNIVASITHFIDNSKERADYQYNAPVDACQLMQISYSLTEGIHTIRDYIPKISFVYDDDGNMLNDEQGQQLIYDSQNRLMSVRNSSGLSVNRYDYDGHNHLTTVTQGSDAATLRFYEGDRLSNTVQGQARTHYLSDGDTPLGQQQVGDTASTALLLMTNASNSVIGEIQQSELRTAVYKAYGERSSNDGELQSLLAFNGEVRDPSCGWYLLGKGYRAYNPELMRFHSPDSMSPFGAGGLNPYGYCIGNPIAFQDPTGHSVGQLYYNQHETDGLAIALTWGFAAMGIAFSVASFGALSPVMMAVVGVGIATEIASASMITVSLATSDPEKADKMFKYGVVLSMANGVLGFAGMSKWGMKVASRKASIAYKNVFEIENMPYDFKGLKMGKDGVVRHNPLYKNSSTREHVNSLFPVTDANNTLNRATQTTPHASITQEIVSNVAPQPPKTPATSPASTQTTESIQQAQTSPNNKEFKHHVEIRSGMNYAASHPLPGQSTYKR
ncbi:YD repeat-containing protein [Pseudomonas coronafaciens pv. zizaniae]|nr:YD repeat-containing protein [Pseudomonas coronafaciens pv. zizaniae]